MEKPRTKREVLEYLLNKYIKQKKPILIVGLENKNIPNIHNFYPGKYYETIKHCGFGLFKGKTPNGAFYFNAGGAMIHFSFGNSWLSFTPLSVENEKVLQDLNYDFERVEKALIAEIAKL